MLATPFGCGEDADPSEWLPGGSAGDSETPDDEESADEDEDEDEPPADDDDAPPEDDEDEPPPDDDEGDAASETLPSDTDESTSSTGTAESSESSTGEPIDPPPFDPLYRITTRIHRGNSGLTDDELLGYLLEMNTIWREQAAVCFEFEVVDHDDPMPDGFDMWFQPEVGGPNGYYSGDHDIWVRDYPSLGSAPNPVEYGGARTAAHELGHGLTLDHDQSSDDYLMRSGTQGFAIPDYQITASRERAAQKALADTTPLKCGDPVF